VIAKAVDLDNFLVLILRTVLYQRLIVQILQRDKLHVYKENTPLLAFKNVLLYSLDTDQVVLEVEVHLILALGLIKTIIL